MEKMLNPSVLIVEDNLDMRDLYQTVLQINNIQALVASSRDEALEILSTISKPPKLILVDCQCPGMSFQEFHKCLQNNFPNVLEESSLIGFSSFNEDAPQIKAIMPFTHGYLPKPANIVDFVKKVETYI